MIIKIYVGTQPEQMLALKVLEYSIRQHTTMAVEVIPLFAAVAQAGIEIPTPKSPQNRPRTPFSFQRFAIPALNNYQGRAIYLDSDMQVFQDIAQLWEWDFAGADLLSVYEPPDSARMPQFSVMVLNCQQLSWNVKELIEDLDAGKWTYQQFMLEMAPAQMIARILPTVWNELEKYQEGKTALTHYTDMPTQPWLSTINPLGWLWCQELLKAIADDFISKEFVFQEVQRGWVRPSLLYQLKHNIIDPLKLPQPEIKRDNWQFLPPHAVKPPMNKMIHSPETLTWVKKLATRGYILARSLWHHGVNFRGN